MRLPLSLAVLSLSACSLIGTRRPDPRPLTEPPTCSPNYGRPIADTIFGALAVGATVPGAAIAANPTVQPDGSSNAGAGVVLATSGIALAGLFIASAVFGYSRTNDCQAVVTEWNAGEAERQRIAEAAHLERLAGAQARREKQRAAAAELLRCELATLKVEAITFDEHDPIKRHWGWVEEEATGCERAAWCGDRPQVGPSCAYPPDFYTASAQLAVETRCPAAQIDAQMRQVFTRRTWVAGVGESFQVTWRLNACGRPYTCSVVAGAAANITCKAALDAAP